MAFLPLRLSDDDRKTLENMSLEAREKALRTCRHAILVLSHDRSVLKKKDISSSSTNYRVNDAILLEANRELHKDIRLRLYEIEKGKYILVNSELEFAKCAKIDESKYPELAVLYFVLTSIFTSPDEKLSEEELNSIFLALAVGKDEAKAFLGLFVKKNYIIAESQQHQEESKLYKWGPRAFAEVDPDSFFSNFLSVHGESDEKDWPELKLRIEKLKQIS